MEFELREEQVVYKRMDSPGTYSSLERRVLWKVLEGNRHEVELAKPSVGNYWPSCRHPKVQ